MLDRFKNILRFVIQFDILYRLGKKFDLTLLVGGGSVVHHETEGRVWQFNSGRLRSWLLNVGLEC